MYTTVKDKQKLKERVKQQSKDRSSIEKRYVHYSMDTTEKLRNDLKQLLDNGVIVKATFKDAQYLYRCMLEWKIEVDGEWEYGFTEHSEQKMMDETGISKVTLNRSLDILVKLGYMEKFEASVKQTPHVYVINLLPPDNEEIVARMVGSTAKEEQSEDEKTAPERTESSVEATETPVDAVSHEEVETPPEPNAEASEPCEDVADNVIEIDENSMDEEALRKKLEAMSPEEVDKWLLEDSGWADVLPF